MRIIGGQNRGTKLYTLEGLDTRPTLDRVKEALFSKIDNKIKDGVVLDLFSGSGALGLESLSRGAKEVYLCDNSFKAIKIIESNIKKTKHETDAKLLKCDYTKALEVLKEKRVKFDVIFLDPPYKTDYNIKATNLIIQYNLLNDDGIIIIETDLPKEVEEGLKELSVNVFDIKKYGRVSLIFLRKD